MKKTFFAFILFLVMASCNDGATDSTETNDSTGVDNQTAVDTTTKPSGMDNSSAISTDTSAMNVNKAIDKADSSSKKVE